VLPGHRLLRLLGRGVTGGFSIAGEKMPWLTTHITLPMILLLAGWSIGKLDRRHRLARSRERWPGWSPSCCR
jgi:hypothetical protein